jgi:hypothetical protein
MADNHRPLAREPQRAPQRRVIYTGENRFKYDDSRRPAGVAYAWKRVTMAGQEDTEHQILCEMNGWKPVPANRHPELMGPRATDQPIIRGGQMLMEQPEEWAQESRMLEEFTAKQTLEQQVQRYGLQGRRGAGSKGGVARSMEAIPELIGD